MIDNIKCLCEVQEQPKNMFLFWSLLVHLNLGHINKIHFWT